MHQKKKMTHHLNQQTTRHLAIVVAEYGVFYFLPKKTHLQPIFGSKHLGSTIETLLNQSIAMKNIKNRSKTRTPPETKKKLPKIKYNFLRVFQVKKHIILTLLIIRNHLTQKTIVLVVKFLTNRYILSLSRNLVIFSLSSNQKKIENK